MERYIRQFSLLMLITVIITPTTLLADRGISIATSIDSPSKNTARISITGTGMNLTESCVTWEIEKKDTTGTICHGSHKCCAEIGLKAEASNPLAGIMVYSDQEEEYTIKARAFDRNASSEEKTTSLKIGNKKIPLFGKATVLDQIKSFFTDEKTGSESIRKNFKADENPRFEYRFPAEKGILDAGKKPEKGKVTVQIFNSTGQQTGISAEAAENSDGTYNITIHKPRSYRPGSYRIKIEYYYGGKTNIQEQNFTWGVLAINTDKATYNEKETAFISMAVLDDSGRIECNAELKLAITSPEGKKQTLDTKNGIKVSPECEFLGVTQMPDYYAYYNTTIPGTYNIELIANTKNGQRSLNQSFNAGNPEYDITRKAATRIYPAAKYTTELIIKTAKEAIGEVQETVPREFEITPAQGMSISTTAEERIITWNITERETTLRYEYDAPDISPYLYQAGPLKINGFTEARTWMIASDSVGKIGSASQGYVLFINGTSNTTPFLKHFNGSEFPFTTETLQTIDEGIKWAVIRSSPVRDERIIVVSDNGSDINAIVCNPNCGSPMELTTAMTNVERRGFDVAYEQVSGDAMIVFSDTTAIPKYIKWDGTSWGASQPLQTDTCTGNNQWAVLAAKPGSNEIIAGLADGQSDLCIQAWNGTEWINHTKIDPNLETLAAQAYDIAYETSTGNAMIIFAEATTSGPVYNIWNGTGLQYTTNQNAPSTDAPSINNMKLAADPGSNRILYGGTDTGQDDLNILQWNGTHWGSRTGGTDYDGSIGTVSSPRTFDVSFIGDTGRGAIFYRDGSDNFPNYGVCNTESDCQAGTWSAAGTACPSSADTGSIMNWVSTATSYLLNELMIITISTPSTTTGQENIYAHRFDGTSCQSTHLGNATSVTTENAMFTYNNNPAQNPPYYLRMLKILWDITDANENTNLTLSPTSPPSKITEANVPVSLTAGTWSSQTCFYLHPRLNNTMFGIGNANLTLWLRAGTASIQSINFTIAEVYGNGTQDFYESNITDGLNIGTSYTRAVLDGPSIHGERFQKNSTIRACILFNADTTTTNTIVFDNFTYNSSLNFNFSLRDIFPPTWNSNRTNQSGGEPKKGGTIQLNLTISDNYNLGSYIYSTNDSGTWVNSTPQYISGKNITIVINETIDSVKGKMVSWMLFINDSVNNTNSTIEFAYTVNNTQPSFIQSLQNQTINSSSAFYYDVNCTDNDLDAISYFANTTLFSMLEATGEASFTAGEIHDGIYQINVSCSDGETNATTQYNLTILDNTSPQVTLNMPNPFNTSSNNVSFNYTATDGLGIRNATLWLNFTGTWRRNNSNETALQNNTMDMINITMTEGSYLWNIQACDKSNAANCNFNSSNMTAYIDTTPPIISIISINQGQTYNSTITLNSSINDTMTGSKISHYTYEFGSETGPYKPLNLTGTRYRGYWNSTLDTTTLDDGTYNITVNSTDFAGNNRTEKKWIIIDNTPPFWNTAQANQSSIFQNDTINFSTMWADTIGLTSFIFSINQTGTWQNSSTYPFSGATNTSQNITAITANPATNVSWKFYARDASGWWNETKEFTFIVMDTNPPTITIEAPNDNANQTTTNASFNFTINDYSPIKNATLWINITGQWMENNSNTSIITRLQQYSINVTEIPEGVFTWSIQACDDSKSGINCAFSPNRTTTIDRTPPLFSGNITNETEEHPKQGGVMQLNITITDNHQLSSLIYGTNDSGFWTNQTFYIGGNAFNISINETVDSPVNKMVGWQIFFNDTSGNTNQTIQMQYEIRPGGGDTSPPAIILNSPQNNRKTASQNISFNFTMNEPSGIENATIWTNMTGIWEANTTNQTNVSSGTMATINLTIPSDGDYIWNVEACDRAPIPNCGFTSINYTFTIDTNRPQFSNNQTDPESPTSYSVSASFSFNTSWTDREIDTVLIEHNFTGSLANYTTTKYSSTYYYQATGLKAGMYTWKQYANDTAGNMNDTPTHYFNITRQNAEVALYINGTRSGRNYEIYDIANFTAKINTSEASLNITTNMSLNANGTSNLTNVTELTQLGSFMINASFAGNENITESYESWTINVLDTKKPNSTNTQGNFTQAYRYDYIMFNSTWGDNYNLSTFIFSINQTGTWQNSTPIQFQGKSNVSFNITQITAPEGTNIAWQFFANDSSGNMNETQKFNFTVMDSQPPNITLIFPGDKSNLSTTSINFTFLPSENIRLKNATLWTNITGTWERNQSNQTSLINGSLNNFSLTYIPEGTFIWNIRAFDNTNLSNFSSRNYTVTIDRTLPQIALKHPNSSYTSDSLVELNFTVTEQGPRNCSLYADFRGTWEINETLTHVDPEQLENFSKIDLPNGSFTWNVECIDYSGNRNFNSTNYTFIVDTAKPAISLTSPANNTKQTDTSTATFRYSSTDNLEIGNCSLILNDAIIQTDSSARVNTSLTFTKTLDNGDYNWSINCTDLAGNTGSSETRNLSISMPFPEPIALLAYYSNNGTQSQSPKYRLGNGTLWENEMNASSISEEAQWVILRAAPARDEWIMGTLDSAGHINAQVFDGVAWGQPTEMTTAVGTANSKYKGMDFAYETNSSRALIVYNVNTGTPAYRLWNGTDWEPQGSLAADACVGIPVWIILVSNPIKDEILEVDLDTSGDYCAQAWNGSEWISQKTLATAGQMYTSKSFDAAYEQSTGNAMVAWESSTAGIISTINYSSVSTTTGTWNATITNFADAGATNIYIRLAPMRSGRRIMLASMEAAAANSYDINAVEWNGATWGTYVTNFDQATASTGDGPLDAAYIGTTGDAMIVYNDYASPSTSRSSFRTCTGSANCNSGTWNAAQFTTAAGNNCGEDADLDYIMLDPDPNSNRILLYAEGYANHTKCTQEYSGTWQQWTQNIGNGSVQGNSSGFAARYARHRPDTVDPGVTLNNPTPGQSINQTNVTFNFTATDNYRTKNATIWTNFTGTWTENNSLTYLQNNASNIITVNDTAEGIFTWNVYVTDTSKNSVFSSSNKTFVIDRTSPFISISHPSDNHNTTNTTIQFNWSTTDLTSTECNISIDGVVRQSGIATSQESVNITLEGIQPGVHRWNVTCMDNASNINVTINRTLTIVGIPSNITPFARNGKNVTLNWTNETFAERYAIFITDNFTSGFQAVPNETITDTNWTDINTSNDRARYYRIAAIKNDQNMTTVITAGKYELKMNEGWNFISIPFNLTNYELENGSNSGFDFSPTSDCIRSLWRFNASQQFERTDYNGTAWIPATGSENFTHIQRGKGYWVETNDTCSLTFLGIVPETNLTQTLNEGWNMVSWHSVENKTLETNNGAPLIVTSPANKIQAINRYNPGTMQFEVTVFYMDGETPWGWWPSWNNQEFTQMEPSRGYYIDSTGDTTWTHTP
ncbi:hypothetical protein HYU11_04720 [Candidatus Woesearchaeota archaeon]|nr:hypothetical protein [Candidatus Woesearchaeota archaeon]